MVPTAAAKHFVFSSGRPERILKGRCRMLYKPVLTPLPNVAVHVIQSPLIWAFQSHRMRRAFSVLCGPRKLMCFGFRIAKTEVICASGPAGVFPFCFTWQPVFVVRGEAARRAFARCQFSAVGVGLFVRNFFDGKCGMVCEEAGVLTLKRRKLCLRYFIFTYPEIASDRDRMFPADEASRLDQYHVCQRRKFGIGSVGGLVR